MKKVFILLLALVINVANAQYKDTVTLSLQEAEKMFLEKKEEITSCTKDFNKKFSLSAMTCQFTEESRVEAKKMVAELESLNFSVWKTKREKGDSYSLSKKFDTVEKWLEESFGEDFVRSLRYVLDRKEEFYQVQMDLQLYKIQRENVQGKKKMIEDQIWSVNSNLFLLLKGESEKDQDFSQQTQQAFSLDNKGNGF